MKGSYIRVGIQEYNVPMKNNVAHRITDFTQDEIILQKK